jgi:predicted TIM-barrel fold metal-dependent hydrolase
LGRPEIRNGLDRNYLHDIILYRLIHERKAMKATQTVPDLDSLELFDSCVTLGRVVYSGTPEYITVDNILSIMDRYHIKEALVHDHHARLIYPREHGNRNLLDTVKGIERVHPVWVIEPPRLTADESADDLVTDMIDAGVKAARLTMHPVSPLPWLWHDLLALLEKHSIPCFLDFGEVSTRGKLEDNEVNNVRDIACAHPGIPLILSHVMGGLGVHPGIMHLIPSLPNLYMDVTGILEYWREIAHKVGPERVLFGTGMPFTDPGILISNIQYAVGFSFEEKKLMAGDNIRRLLGEVK